MTFSARILALAVALILAALGLTACSGTRYDLPWSSKTPSFFDKEDNTPIVELNYAAADRLTANLKKTLPPGSPIYFEPLADMNDPSAQRPFGLVVMRQVAARLTQNGFRITEGSSQDPARPAPAKPGEFDLAPRNSTLPDTAPPREALLRGTYLLGKNVIYLSAQVVRLDDRAVVSGYDWTLPNNKNTRELLPQLKSSGMSPAVKTMPDPITSSPIMTPLPGEKPLNDKKKQ